MARRLALGAVALALLAGPAAGNAVAACTAPAKATAYDNPADRDAAGTISDDQWLAQSFTLPASITLTKVSLYLRNSGATTRSITAEIHSDSGGTPGALLGSPSARTPTNTAYEFVDFDFSAAHIALAGGTTYYVVMKDTTSPGVYDWGLDQTSATYAGGNVFFTDATHTWSGNVTKDFLFQVFGQSCTADSPPPGGGPALAAVSGLAFFHKTFSAEAGGPSATLGRKSVPKGSRVSYTLNEAASVKFTVKRRARGRRVKRGKRKVCARPTRRNRKKRRCVRHVPVRGSFTLNGAAGKNSFHFTGRLAGKKLKPGRYRLVATPSVGGVKGRAVSARFRIVP